MIERRSFWNQYWRILIFTLGLIIFLWLLWILRDLLIPFGLGLILAYLLMPIIRWAESRLPQKDRWRQAKRIILVVLIYLLTLAAIGLFLYFTVPPVIDSAMAFFESLPQLIPDLIDRLQSLTNALRERVPPQIQSQLDSYFSSLLGTLGTAIQAGLTAGFLYLTSTIGFILGFASLPIFLFFILKDEEKVQDALFANLSPWLARHVRGVMGIFENVVGRYVKSSLLLALAVGLLDLIGLLILGIPFAPALAFVAAVTELVPIIGPWIGGAAGVVVTLATDTSKTLWVILLYFIVQQLEGNVLVPRIHSQYLNIHPALILVLIVLAAHFGGLWGVILVTPATALLVQLYKFILHSINEEKEDRQKYPTD